jgi:hypothetical protein
VPARKVLLNWGDWDCRGPFRAQVKEHFSGEQGYWLVEGAGSRWRRRPSPASSFREDTIAFAELGLRLLELHQPRDADGISSDPDSPIRRCRACMWRWPCPTFRAIEEAVDH